MRPLSLLVLLLAAACTGPARRPARISHLVFFKLREPGQCIELLADCDRALASIPGVVAYAAGRPFEMGRDRVDGDYDVGLYVGFDDPAAYQDYLAHPDHRALVEKWRTLWEWIRIYDVLDDTP